MSVATAPSIKEQSLSPEALAFVRSVGTATDLPAFVQNVRAIATVASDLDARVALLEAAIVTDVALTGKVLRIATSALSGTGTTVTSVKQAIMLLGYERVQQLSSAASVFTQIEETAPAVKDLLVLSLLTANQSLCLAVEAGYGRPELAYLCGLFRNLGEVLVACYRARKYQEWCEERGAGDNGVEGAEESFFGFTFDDVGMVLAQQWGMPAELVQTLCRVAPPEGTPPDRLHYITQFSADLTRRTLGDGLPDDSDTVVDALLNTYTKVLGVDRAAVRLATTMAEVASMASLDTMQVSIDDWRATRAQREAADGRDPLAIAAQALTDLAAECAPNANDSTSEAELRAAVRALTEHRQQDTSFTLGAATESTLNAARSAGYRRAVLALSTEDFKLVRGRLGVGPGHESLVRTFLVRPDAASGPLGAALHARADIFVDLDSVDGKSYKRDRLLRELRVRSIAMLPLVLEGKLMGCLFFENGDEPFGATDTIKTLLPAMRNHLVAAFQKHRERAVAPAA